MTASISSSGSAPSVTESELRHAQGRRACGQLAIIAIWQGDFQLFIQFGKRTQIDDISNGLGALGGFGVNQVSQRFMDKRQVHALQCQVVPLKIHGGRKQDNLALTHLTLNQSGLVAVRGRAAVDPMSVDLDVKLKDISIWPFQAYLDQFLNMDVRDGAINLAGKLRYGKARSKDPLLRFQGDLGVNQLSVSDRKEFEEVLMHRVEVPGRGDARWPSP